MDQDNNKVVTEQHSHHAVRRRCLSSLAAVSIQPSVVKESTPVLLEVLSSAHTGNLSRQIVVYDFKFKKETIFIDETTSGSQFIYDC